MAAIKSEKLETESSLIRRPTLSRLPASFFDEDSNESFGTKSTNTDAVPTRINHAEILRKARLTHQLDDDEEVEIIEREVDEDEFDGEEVLIEEVDEKERTENFKKVSEIIKTVPQIQFQKGVEDVKGWEENEQIIVVPPPDNEISLNDRFAFITNRQMKFSLNQYWQTYNYLKKNEGTGLDLIQKQKDVATKMADRMKKTAVRRLNTVTGKIAKAQEDTDGEKIDPEYFWRENLAYWMAHFEWKRKDVVVSKEELDNEIEEYMASRCNSRVSVCSDFDIDADLAKYMESKGYIRDDSESLDKEIDDSESLDKEMDDYWSKKSKTAFNEKENEGVAPASQTKGWSLSNKMTPQERMRRKRALNSKTNSQLSVEKLDEEMELHQLRQAHKLEKEKEKVQRVEQEKIQRVEQEKLERKKVLAEAGRKKELEEETKGDRFAPDDFDAYDEAMQM